MMNIFHKLKPKGVPVLAFLLALVMLIGIIPFTATEVQAVEITPTAEGAEPFTKDFNLDLWSNENPDKYERHAMHYNGTSWNTLKTNKLYDNTFATAVAGKSTYVYSTNDGYNVNVSMDQMKGNLDDYDMMFASSQIEDASKPLDLHFEHLFVKLTFNIVYGSEYGDTLPTFYFVGIDSHGSLNDTVIISGVQEGKPTRTYSSTEDHTVSAAINYGDADDYTDDKIEVIVGDGTLPAGTEFLLLFRTYDDQNPLTVNVPEGGLTFVAGTHYTFDLKVGKDAVTIEQVSVNGNDPSVPFGDGWSSDTEEHLGGTSSTLIHNTEDEGKTAWVDGDQIIATLTSQRYGEQTAMLTFSGSDGTWSTDESFSYLENETPTVKAVYAPSNILGTGEYIEFDCELNGGELTVKLESAPRNYSRLRIVGLPSQTLTVTTTEFTPAGATSAVIEPYTLTTDNNGNAFLYGVFAEGATINVKQGEVTLADYTFTADKNPNGTEHNKSYALYAGKKVNVDLSTLTATYAINDDAYYTFTGTGSYGIKVESGNPRIVLNNASITVGEGSAIDIASGSDATIFVQNDNSLSTTAQYSSTTAGGIFVAEGGTVNITSNSTNNTLRVTGNTAAAIGGKYVYAGESYNAGNISISNVTVYAYANNYYAAAIGAAGEGTCGTINITNAVVYAYGAGDRWTSAPGIGSAWDHVGWAETIPVVIISGSEIHTFRYNPYSDYIGYLGDEMGEEGGYHATGSINCGEGGSVKSSTIYCYTGLDATTTDKVVTYDADGNPTEN